MTDQQFQMIREDLREVKENSRHHLEHHQKENLDARVAALEASSISYKQLLIWVLGSGIGASIFATAIGFAVQSNFPQ